MLKTGLSFWMQGGRRRVRTLAIVCVCCLMLISACQLPGTPVPTITPVPTLPPEPSPTPTPVPPTPTATPVPTPDPGAISVTVVAGERFVDASGVEPICLRREDTDGDGAVEWLGLYLLPAEPPELLGFVIDGSYWHELAPPESAEGNMGEYAICELEVGDVNADGQVELIVWGHAEASTDLLHVFVWDGAGYALLGAFEGAGGVRMEDADNDLILDVLVRLRPEGSLVREIVYTWDGSHYAWTWDRYAWFYADRPHTYVSDTPLHALASFYLALDDRDLPGAYGLMSLAAQSVTPYEGWALGFASTLAVEVGAARVVTQDEGSALVAAHVQAIDNVNGRIVLSMYEVEWRMVATDAGWRLDSGGVDLLEQRELPYYR